MTATVWTLVLDGRRHTVEVHHGWWSGRRIIVLDGRVIMERKQFLDFGSTHEFTIGDHRCHVVIDVASRVIAAVWLTVDGVDVPDDGQLGAAALLRPAHPKPGTGHDLLRPASNNPPDSEALLKPSDST